MNNKTMKKIHNFSVIYKIYVFLNIYAYKYEDN